MRKIKKYSNRKLYDTQDKKYISLKRVGELVQSGEQVMIVDSRSGEDLTSGIISQILAREKGVPSNVLMQLLQKGQGTFQGTLQAARKYASLWQGALTMAEGEIDRLIGMMVKANEMTESEGSRVKKEIQGFAGSLKGWISENVDQRVNEVMAKMKPATRDQLKDLRADMDAMEKRLAQIEEQLSRE